jgi:hypothetical protein
MLIAEKKSNVDRYLYLLETHPGGDRIWEWDGYRMFDGVENKEYWQIHITCPKCENLLTLDSRKKQIQIGERGIETAEPIRCAWPGEFGLCTWTIEIQPPVGDRIAHARAFNGRVAPVTVDGIIRQV